MRTPKWIALPILAALPLLASCANPPASAEYAVGQTVVVSGQLVLTGNEPFTVPTLLTQSQQWALTGIEKSRWLPLQNKTLRVRGTVVRAPAPGPLQPQIKVIEFEENGAGQ